MRLLETFHLIISSLNFGLSEAEDDNNAMTFKVTYWKSEKVPNETFTKST